MFTLVIFMIAAGLICLIPAFNALEQHQGIFAAIFLALSVGLFALAYYYLRLDRFSARAATVFIVIADLCLFFVQLGKFIDDPAHLAGLMLFAFPTTFVALFMNWRGLLTQAVVVTLVSLSSVFQDETLSGRRLVFLVIAVATTIPAVVVRRLVKQLDQAAGRAVALARTDPLTGMANRRGMQEAWPELVADARAKATTVGVIVLDVDHFKQVNDQYGHAAGDDVLRAISGVLARNARREDLVVRLGGEEIAVLAALPAADLSVMAERVRREVEIAPEIRPAVTVSIGVAWQPIGREGTQEQDGALLWALIDEADERLYTAKHNGRNQVVLPA